MPAKFYFDVQADLDLLRQKTIAVIGYGSQGRAQALNLRDSGCKVITAEPPHTHNYQLALSDGFQPLSTAEAVARSEIAALLLPDELLPDVFAREIRPALSPDKVLVFAHGFNVHFSLLDLPAEMKLLLVAPLGPGPAVRSEYVSGGGVAGLVACRPENDDLALRLALAYAKGIGCTRTGLIHTTFAEETETDLFAEQAVLCGGLSALVQAAFDTLVQAGYQPEIAYLACLYELRAIVELMHVGGPGQLFRSISRTAGYGALTRGPRLITAQTRAEMKEILEEIRDGRFAREFLAEGQAHAEKPPLLGQTGQSNLLEQVSRRLRELFFSSKSAK